MTKYTKDRAILLKLPIGIYDEILYVMKVENRWLTPQDFIKNALNEYLSQWKKEHPGHP
jgi:hypothetical protein